MKVEQRDGATVYSATLTGEGGVKVALREVVRVTPDKLSFGYEATPEGDVVVESILLQGLMSTAAHAGKTRYIAADGGVVQGVCPAEPPAETHIIFGGRDERGNVLDHLDEPLNNARWIHAQLAAARGHSDVEQLAAIARILSWEDPGPGGFYDDLGNAAREPHLVAAASWENDPDCLRRAYEEFSFLEYAEQRRLSWRSQAATLYETPLRMRYTGVDPHAQYRLRVVYAGRFRTTMALTADGLTAIHGPLPPPDPPEVLEFTIPREATAEGVLELE